MPIEARGVRPQDAPAIHAMFQGNRASPGRGACVRHWRRSTSEWRTLHEKKCATFLYSVCISNGAAYPPAE